MCFYALVAFVALLLLANLSNVTPIMCGRSNTAFATTTYDREQEILASEKGERHFFKTAVCQLSLEGWERDTRGRRLDFKISVSSFVFLKSNLIPSRCR